MVLQVPVAQRLEEEVPLEQRVRLLIDTTSYETFQYVAQVQRQLKLHWQCS